MMKCCEMEMLSAYVDGELTEREKHGVEKHLQDCAICQATVAKFSQVHLLYQELEVKGPSSDFRQRVSERLDSQTPFVLPWSLPRPVYTFSCVVLMLFLGVMGTLYLMHQFPFQNSVNVVQEVDIYAEDILFGQTIFSTTNEFFSVGDVNVAEEILSTIEFTDTDTSFFFRNAGPPTLGNSC